MRIGRSSRICRRSVVHIRAFVHGIWAAHDGHASGTPHGGRDLSDAGAAGGEVTGWIFACLDVGRARVDATGSSWNWGRIGS